MTGFFVAYMSCWSLASLAAFALMLRYRGELGLFKPTYRQFLLQRWKVATFLISAISMTVVAPYTGDPTWDYFDAASMAILTFVTAPWAVGILYRAIRGPREKAMAAQVYIAACLWMISVSWAYDLYLVLRDGRYPDTWLPNIFLSSVLYLSAGLLWNLHWRENRGVVFAFMEPEWFQRASANGFGKIAWFALPFMIIAAVLIGIFLV